MLKIIISLLFLNQHNRILHRLVVYKQAYDISQEGSHLIRHHTKQQHHNIINHKVNLFIIIYE